jgi:hypothetical protein
MSACSANACLARLGDGRWVDDVWHWDAGVPACCRFGHVGPGRAAALLRGRHIVFVGDSQSRRHLWAVVDAVGGNARAVRRKSGQAVLDSHVDFDRSAVALNDSLYDSQRAYHAGQTVLLNVDTGSWVLLDPTQLCGVPRKDWMTDHRLTGAISRGQPPPWHTMRGSQYRLRLSVLSAKGTTRGQTRGALRQRARRAVEALARDAMKGWGCQKASIRDCSYHDAIQRNCASRLSVTVDNEAASARDASARDASARDALSSAAPREGEGEGEADEVALIVVMGERGGSCDRAAHALQLHLERHLSDAATSDRPVLAAPTRRRLLGVAPGKRTGAKRRGASGVRFDAAVGGRGASGRGAAGHGLPLPAALRATLKELQRSGPVRLDPHCVSYCRPTSHLECPKSGPSYQSAVHAAVAARPSLLGPRSDNSSLALLTFVYAANLDGEIAATLQHLPNEHAYGHGAQLVVLGATWASVIRTTGPAANGARSRAGGAARTAAGAAGADAAAASVHLTWDAGHTRAWQTALSACAAAAPRCLLRTVPETPRQALPHVYRELHAHLAPIARAAAVSMVDSFSGTWSGVAGHVMAHHDSTRIHFSDTGRAYLAQLTLNALPMLLPHRDGLPPNEHLSELRLASLVPQRQAGGGSAPSAVQPRQLAKRRAARRAARETGR